MPETNQGPLLQVAIPPPSPQRELIRVPHSIDPDHHGGINEAPKVESKEPREQIPSRKTDYTNSRKGKMAHIQPGGVNIHWEKPQYYDIHFENCDHAMRSANTCKVSTWVDNGVVLVLGIIGLGGVAAWLWQQYK